MDVINEWGGLSCDCTNKQPRKRTNKGGAVGYGYQCQNCGRWEPRKKDAFGWSPPNQDYDESIVTKFRERGQQRMQERQVAAEQQRESERQEWRRRYELYLQSPQWESKRQAALKRDRWLCQGCLSRRATQVHHLTYDHLGNELLWELQSVCTECHKIIHPHMRDVDINWADFR